MAALGTVGVDFFHNSNHIFDWSIRQNSMTQIEDVPGPARCVVQHVASPASNFTLGSEEHHGIKVSLNGEIVFLLQQGLFPVVDADAFQHTRQAVSGMPRYTVPRPTVQRRRSK